GYVGSPDRATFGESNLRVVNTSGLYFLERGCTITLTSGDQNTPAYSQSGEKAALYIQTGCTLVVSTAKGVTIAGGAVFVVPTASDNQTATVKADFAMSGGALGFGGAPGNSHTRTRYIKPGQAGQPDVPKWMTFLVDGNVAWSGGTFVPGVDASGGANGNGNLQNNADKWQVKKDMNITKPNQNAAANPIVNPVPWVPPGQQVAAGFKGTWNVIASDGEVKGDDPTAPQGWTVNEIKPAQMRKGYKVTK
ncbi:MAG: hypothetical protein K2V38_23440, partial [Gemmataceae bacterium]|nr:hypothetical protein [Gemmataceae bacterium]